MINKKIRTKSNDHCYLCGSKGDNLYHDVEDRLFGVKGAWNIDKCSNNKCGLLWLNPMPITEDLPRLYDNYYTHIHPPEKKANKLIQIFRDGCSTYLSRKYGYPFHSTIASKILASLIKLNPKWAANLDFSVFYLSVKPSGKLLEIGCGSGEMLKNMQKLGWDVTGIDFDAKCVSTARELGLNVYQGDITQLKFEENQFDAIVMSHVIEHLPNPAETLNQCYSLLKKGGKLVSVTPNTDGVLHSKFKLSWLHLDPPRHLYLYNKNTLVSLAEKAGFININCFSTLRDITGLWKASKNIKLGERVRMNGSNISLNQKFFIAFQTLILGYLIKLGLYEGDEIVIISSK